MGINLCKHFNSKDQFQNYVSTIDNSEQIGYPLIPIDSIPQYMKPVE